MGEQRKTLPELLQRFASLKGLPARKVLNGLACRMEDGTVVTLFDRPVTERSIGGRWTAYGSYYNPSGKIHDVKLKLIDEKVAAHLRGKMEESIEILELRARIMDPKNLETAERMARKRRKLQEVYDLLSNYPTMAEIKVTVRINPDKPKEAVICEDTFNALVCKLAEDEINNINKFVESL